MLLAMPCAKFSRATSMPAAIIPSSTLALLDAGPMVATILVERIRLNIPTGGVNLSWGRKARS